MGKKKRKNAGIPRCKRMKRGARLQSAKAWIPTYPGRSIVHGYAKHFAVSKLCAALELRMIGTTVDDAYIQQLKTQELVIAQQREILRRRRREREAIDSPVDSDETFAYIAGYTSWGFAYGVTWEEMRNMEERPSPCNDDCDDYDLYSKPTEPEQPQTRAIAEDEELPF